MAKAGFGDFLRFLFRKEQAKEAGDRSDRDLLSEFAASGSDAPFTVLFERHGPMVFAVCKRILGDFHQAEDALQATFHILARRAHTIQSRGSIGPWLHAVAGRVATRTKAKRSSRQDLERRKAMLAPTETIDDAAWQDLSSVLDEELGRLPEKYRAPLVLSYLESKSRAKVAKELGCPEGTVARRLERGRDLLRLRLVKRGVTLSAAALGANVVEKLVAAPVPTTVAVNTIKAATLVAAGQSSAGGFISATALKLAEETMHAMLFVKVKLALVVIAVSVALSGAGLAGYKALSEPGQAVPLAKEQEKGKEIVKVKEAVARDIYGDRLPEGAVARLGTIRWRHDGTTMGLVFAEKGKTLVAKTDLGYTLFDADTGKEREGLSRLENVLNPSGQNRFVAVSPDGNKLATVPRNGLAKGLTLDVWDLNANRKEKTLTLQIEDPAGAKAKGATGLQIRYMAFCPDGKNLIFCFTRGQGFGKAAAVDLSAEKIQRYFGEWDSPYEAVCMAPNGKMFAAISGANRGFGDRKLELIDFDSGKVIQTLTNEMGKGTTTHQQPLAFSPDGKVLAYNGRRDFIALFDSETGQNLGQIKIQTFPSLAFDFTPDSKYLIACGTGSVTIWDWANKSPVKTIKTSTIGTLTRPVEAIALSPDGKTLAVGYNGGKKIRLWDLMTGEEKATDYGGHDTRVMKIAYAPDGKSVASIDETGKTNFWDLKNSKIERVLPGGGQGAALQDIDYSSDGTRYLRLGFGNVAVYNMVNGQDPISLHFPGEGHAESASFSADGQKVFTLERRQPEKTDIPPKIGIPAQKMVVLKRMIRRWNAQTGEEEKAWTMPDQAHFMGGRVNSGKSYADNVEFILGKDGRTVCFEIEKAAKKIGGSLGQIEVGGDVGIFDVERGIRLLSGKENENGQLIAPSPDGRIVASAIVMRNTAKPIPPAKTLETPWIAFVRLWEVVSGKEIAILKDCPAKQIAWSGDGRLLATGAGGLLHENQVQVWDTANAEKIAVFENIPATVHSLAFSADAKQLAVGLGDTTIVIYDLGKALSKLKSPLKLTQSDLDARWADLTGDDPNLAYKAIWTLVLAPKQAVTILQNKLKPVALLEQAKVQKWLEELESEVFAVRQNATIELEKNVDQARSCIRDAAKKTSNLETLKRLDKILEHLADTPRPETVHTVRAISALERIGSPEAQAVLETLANGAPGARETEEATAAWERLNRKSFQRR